VAVQQQQQQRQQQRRRQQQVVVVVVVVAPLRVPVATVSVTAASASTKSIWKKTTPSGRRRAFRHTWKKEKRRTTGVIRSRLGSERGENGGKETLHCTFPLSLPSPLLLPLLQHHYLPGWEKEDRRERRGGRGASARRWRRGGREGGGCLRTGGRQRREKKGREESTEREDVMVRDGVEKVEEEEGGREGGEEEGWREGGREEG